MMDPAASIRREGYLAAVERVKLLFRAAIAGRLAQAWRPADAQQSAMGAQIAAAVEALPDDRLLKALPDEQRKKIEDLIVRFEINHHANKMIEYLDGRPHPPISGRGFTPGCACLDCAEREAEAKLRGHS